MFVETEARPAGEPAKVLDDASKMLLRAADFIEMNGLSCGGQVDARGRPCTVVVIDRYCGGIDNQTVASDAFKRLRDVVGPIGSWSDNTPVDKVVAKLRAVALGL